MDALRLVRSFGRDTVSFQALEEGVSLWTDASVAPDGAVAYVDTGEAWVAAGAPLAPQNRVRPLARAFVRAAAASGRRACFCAIEQPIDPEGLLRPVCIGEQPVWDPRKWPETLKSSKSLREQLRRARAKGVELRRLTAEELEPGHPVRAEATELVARWLSTRGGPPLRFLLDIQLFSHVEERRLFLATRAGVAVGLLSAVPVFARGGWFFEDIVRAPDAPNGTAEALIDAGMTRLAEEGATRVTMGLVPLAGNEVPFWLRPMRWLRTPFYDFEGLRRFREKLKPERWEPVFIGKPYEASSAMAIWDAMAAITGGSPLAWGRAALTKP